MTPIQVAGQLCRIALILHIAGLSVWASTINVPGDFATIQQAVDAASDCDTILVGPGTYSENIKFSRKGHHPPEHRRPWRHDHRRE